jgi:tRNA-modifying protein YgfZ
VVHKPPDEFLRQYAALRDGAGIVDYSARTQIELTGADRATFLHNLCTNAVRDLAPGSGCESFLLNVKGHVIGHVWIFVSPHSIVLETVPGQGERITAHLDRYLIREDVQIFDRTAEWGEVLLAGAKAEEVLEGLGVAVGEIAGRLSHAAARLAGRQVWLRRVDFLGPGGFLVAGLCENMEEVKRTLVNSGAVECGADVAETARIESGTPWYGQDITDENLPQEVDRNRLAISFTKGCYLGQETVARIDALGHVNRVLRGVKLSGEAVPAAGTELQADGKTVGKVTSSCWSPATGGSLALAYVRRGFEVVGTKLGSSAGSCEVVQLSVGE